MSVSVFKYYFSSIIIIVLEHTPKRINVSIVFFTGFFRIFPFTTSNEWLALLSVVFLIYSGRSHARVLNWFWSKLLKFNNSSLLRSANGSTADSGTEGCLFESRQGRVLNVVITFDEVTTSLCTLISIIFL